MSKLIAGWVVFYIILFHLMIVLIPIVADEYKEKYSDKSLDIPHLCPYPLFKHGVGSDLKTFRIVKDLCTDY